MKLGNVTIPPFTLALTPSVGLILYVEGIVNVILSPVAIGYALTSIAIPKLACVRS